MPIKVQGTEIVTNQRKLINLDGAAVTGIVTSLVAGTGINISGATGRVTISNTNTTDLQQVSNVIPDYDNSGDYSITDGLSFTYGFKAPAVSIANTTNNAGLNFFGIDILREAVGLTQYSGGFSLFTQNSTYDYYDNFINAMPSTGMTFGSSSGFSFCQVEPNGDGGPFPGNFSITAIFNEYPQLKIRGSVGIGSTLIVANANPDLNYNGGIDLGDSIAFFQGKKTSSVSIANTTSNAGLNFFGGDILRESSGLTQYSGGFSLFTQNSSNNYYDNYISAMPSNGMNFGTNYGFGFYKTEVNGSAAPISCVSLGFDVYPELDIKTSVGIGSTLIVANADPDINNNGTFSALDASNWLVGRKTYSNSIINKTGTAGINFYEEDVIDNALSLNKGTGGFTLFTAGSGGVGIGTTWAYSPAYIQGGRQRMTFGTGEQFVFARTLGYDNPDRYLVIQFCTNEDVVEINGEDIIIPTNKVGIGTTNPVNRLQIGNGSIGFQGGNVRIGDEAGRGSDPNLATGVNNIFLGFRSGYNVTTGSANISIGRLAGCGVTDGQSNVFIGQYSGCCNSTGSKNNIIGYGAGRRSIAGDDNNIFGTFAGRYNNGGNCNTFIGPFAGQDNTIGNNNIYIGPNSGSNYCDGNINIAIGNNSLNGATTGSNNIAIGSSSGTSNAASLISITTQSNRIIIGNKDHTNFYTKMATTGSGGNAVCFNSTTYELYSTSSSARYKENIRPFLSGVKEILDIEPVKFTYTERPDDPEQVGFIAEQLDEVGLNHFVTYNGENQPESVTYDRVIVLAINAIKELHKENQDLKLRVIQLENIIGISSGSSQ